MNLGCIYLHPSTEMWAVSPGLNLQTTKAGVAKQRVTQNEPISFLHLCQAGCLLHEPKETGAVLVALLKPQHGHVHVAFAPVSVLEGLVLLPLSSRSSSFCASCAPSSLPVHWPLSTALSSCHRVWSTPVCLLTFVSLWNKSWPRVFVGADSCCIMYIYICFSQVRSTLLALIGVRVIIYLFISKH